MNILFVAHVCPWPLRNGTKQRIYYLLKGLAQRHRVTAVIPEETAEDAGALPVLGAIAERVIPVRPGPDVAANKLRYNHWAPAHSRAWRLVSRRQPSFILQAWSHALCETLSRLRDGQVFDAVWIESAQIAAMARHVGFRRFVTDLHSLESVSLERGLRSRTFYWSKPLHSLEATKAGRYERRLPGLSGPVVVCKDEDRQFFGSRSRDVVTAPNGVPELPLADQDQAVPGRMLFVGDLSYEPNVDAVLYFQREILPAIRNRNPKAHLLIIGRGRNEAITAIADGGSVIYQGEVDNLDEAFNQTAIFVVSMRGGGGTRMKVLEALARGAPVVSTSIGVEGIDIRSGIDALVEDEPRSFAEACISLLGDDQRRRDIGMKGRDLVRARYGWPTAVDAAEEALAMI